MINHLKVEIVPFHINKEYREMKICVETDKMKYHFHQAHSPDDLTSYFDDLFDMAKEVIKKELLEKENA